MIAVRMVEKSKPLVGLGCGNEIGVDVDVKRFEGVEDVWPEDHAGFRRQARV